MKLPKSFYNWTSLSGAIIALITMFMIVFLIVISSYGEGSSYLGLVIYLVLPLIMIIGLIMIPIGVMFYMRRLKRTGKVSEKKWPYIDLNYYRHRNAFLIFTFGTVLFLLLSSVGSYEAFHYTESVEFCGTLCHDVMEPEYVAYQNSPHARVACVECHVGSGANWYMRSKLSGLYQVYAVLADILSQANTYANYRAFVRQGKLVKNVTGLKNFMHGPYASKSITWLMKRIQNGISHCR